MIAIDARLASSFSNGLLAAVNPCGFALLPTYLLYFLGMESLRPGAERSSIRRALTVSAAVSGGFLLVFVVIGAIYKWSTSWFVDKSQWISLAIGIALVVLGVAMIFGFRIPFTTPKLDIGRRDRTVRSMFVFGIAYAVASIGCTIGLFTGVVLGTVSTDGIVRGVVAIGLYGLGMALIVTGLTVTLAMANTALLAVLRKGMAVFEYLAGVFVLLTGLYLSWYWYNSISERGSDRVITKATSWQESLASFIQRNQTAVVVAACIAIGGAIVAAALLRRQPTPEPG
ncbi:MAG: putative cytochrome c biosis protein [Ilumatobacteraceae bacterium]|nr:putative cytochrome c biosis protein [Ilumatobacteraceae bacterium]